LMNRIELFSNPENKYNPFTINGVDAYREKGNEYVFTNRLNNRLFGYHAVDNESLDMSISVPKDQQTTFTLYEASFDLLENELFSIPKRARNMIPKPFVLNDAVVMKKSIVVE